MSETQRRKHGDRHPSGDGRVFMHYQKKGSEYWVTEDVFLESKKKKRAASAAKYAKVRGDKPWRERKNPKETRPADWVDRRFKHPLTVQSNAKGMERAVMSRQRLRKTGAEIPLDHSNQFETQAHARAWRIGKCLRVQMHVDHFFPISRGGIHHHTNLRVIPKPLNCAKNWRMDHECNPQLLEALSVWTVCANELN